MCVCWINGFARRLYVPLLVLSLLGLPSLALAFTGQVMRISDGDTLSVWTDRREIKVRIYGIDTPERNQPWGREATRALAQMVEGQRIRVDEVDQDRWGRIVGRIFVEGRDIGREMVRQGHAWVYRHYTNDFSLISLEATARNAHLGLWRLPESQRIAPWEWRRRQRSAVFP